MSTNVNVFVTFVNLGGTNVVATGTSAFIRLNGFAPIDVLNLVDVLLYNYLVTEEIGNSLFVTVVVSALVNVPVNMARFSSG